MNDQPKTISDLRIRETPRTLRELALDRIRSAIVELRFQPGERLTERDLCERLGVSRSVVREVIRHLESEGLVQTVPFHGPIVARLDADQAAEIYQIRSLLEAAAASACAQRATAEEKKRLRVTLHEIGDAYQARDFQAVLNATTRFYEIIFACGGKSVGWEVVQRLNGRISRLRAMTIASPGREREGMAQMRKIYEAIRKGDQAAAAEACRAHVENAASLAHSILERQAES